MSMPKASKLQHTMFADDVNGTHKRTGFHGASLIYLSHVAPDQTPVVLRHELRSAKDLCCGDLTPRA